MCRGAVGNGDLGDDQSERLKPAARNTFQIGDPGVLQVSKVHRIVDVAKGVEIAKDNGNVNGNPEPFQLDPPLVVLCALPRAFSLVWPFPAWN